MGVGGKQFQQLTTSAWNDHTPARDESGDGFYFLNERSGTLNVWHQRFEGGEDGARQVTKHDTHPVRDLSVADNGAMAYNLHGQVQFGTPGVPPQPVDTTVLTSRLAQPQRIEAGTPRLGILDIHGDWLERKTTEPDVLVYAHPDGIVAGEDIQLRRAVEVLLQELDSGN
jgi:hypothetical protein